jgi:hypothetical protein
VYTQKCGPRLAALWPPRPPPPPPPSPRRCVAISVGGCRVGRPHVARLQECAHKILKLKIKEGQARKHRRRRQAYQSQCRTNGAAQAAAVAVLAGACRGRRRAVRRGCATCAAVWGAPGRVGCDGARGYLLCVGCDEMGGLLGLAIMEAQGPQCRIESARCTLYVACCTLHAACCTLHAACCTLHAACCTLHAARCTLPHRTVASLQEMEVCLMIIECCSQERTWLAFYGLLGERFCKVLIREPLHTHQPSHTSHPVPS